MTRHRARGFTLLELLAALTIAGLLLAVSVPATMRFYDSIQYRQAVREVITLLGSARHAAINEGRFQDVVVDPRNNQLSLDDTHRRLPAALDITVHSARELNRDGLGIIRFYPEGGSSGGGVDIQRPGGDGVRISVDWLVGRVSQQAYAPE